VCLERELVQVGVLLRRMRRLTAILVVLSAACSGSPGASPEQLYLTSATARRAAMVASLVNPANGYAQLRLAHYDSGDSNDWSLLPEANPRVQVLSAADLRVSGGVDATGGVLPSAQALAFSTEAENLDADALVALGEDAFFHYPVQPSLALATALRSPDAFAEYGFWTDAARGAGGVVLEENPDGSSVPALTCASCHVASRPSGLVLGAGNDRLDLGRLAVDAARSPDPAAAANLLAWGPGRVDVTTSSGTEPVRIADVRPVAWVDFLHADGNVRNTDTTTLAIRLETLIVTSRGALDRPPRLVALALATYVRSLAAALPASPPSSAAEARGASVFAASCQECHAGTGLTGPSVPLSVVGTDPRVGLSRERGTGDYRVPSLHGVSTRGPLLHDASIPDLATFFDPTRLEATFSGGRLGAGPVRGHLFGLDLSSNDRASLVAYLSTL
jgi:hypothetical protein